MVDGSWPIAKQRKTKEEEQWYPFFGDKHTHVVQGATRHHWKGVTSPKEPFEAQKKKDLEDNLPPLIDLEDDLPRLIH
jgi:hypothetical protein